MGHYASEMGHGTDYERKEERVKIREKFIQREIDEHGLTYVLARIVEDPRMFANDTNPTGYRLDRIEDLEEKLLDED